MDKLFVVRMNEQFFVMDETDYEEFPNKNTFILDSFRGVGHHSLDDKDNLALKLKVKENSKIKGVKIK
ncbi:hypothetical protein BpHYR1_038483, partial [Brachionus plicatilis]